MTYLFKIKGMMCHHCEENVSNFVNKNYKVISVNPNHEEGTLIIESDEELNVKEIAKKITEIGYKTVFKKTI